MTALLEVRDLHVRLAGSHILQGVSFDVPEGTVTALLGRNGVGKTTTLRALLGLVPREGHVALGGADITQEQTHKIVRRGVGYVPEDRDVFAALTVTENLELAVRNGSSRFGLRLRPLPRAAVARRAAGRHALGRPAADGRDRAGAAQREPHPARRRADQGPRADGGQRGRGRARAGLPGEHRAARRAEPGRRPPRSPSTSSCSTPGASSTPASPASCSTTASASMRCLGVAMSTVVLLAITGLGLGAMYFLIASGLSLIYGLMGVLELRARRVPDGRRLRHVVLGDEARRRPGRAALRPRRRWSGSSSGRSSPRSSSSS